MRSRTDYFSSMSSVKRRPPLRRNTDNDVPPQNSILHPSTSNGNHIMDSQTLSTPTERNTRRSVSPNRNGSQPSVLANGSSSSRPPRRSPRLVADTVRPQNVQRTSESDDVDVGEDSVDFLSDGFRSSRPELSPGPPSSLYPDLNSIQSGLASGAAGGVGEIDDAVGDYCSSSPRAMHSETKITQVTRVDYGDGIVCRRREISESTTLEKTIIGYNGEAISRNAAFSGVIASAGAPTNEDRASGGSAIVLPLLPFFLVLVLGLVLVLVVVLFLQPLLINRDERPVREIGDMGRLFDVLKESFPNQPRRSWLNFNGPLRAILRDRSEAEAPAVLLIAGDPATVRCLVSKTASLLHQVTSSSRPRLLVFEGKQLQNHDPLAAKNLINSGIQSHLGEERGKVVVIFDVDSIPAEATILLHAFADHENAPFKDAFFFLTVQGGNEYRATAASSGDELKAIERRVNKDVTQKLSRTLGIDATLALMARIGNSVVVVAAEEGDERRCR